MGPDLMAEMRAQAERFGTDVLAGNVVAVDILRRPFTITLSEREPITTDSLIVATGASARWLEIGSDRKLSGHGVSTCATCDGYFFRGRPIAVVGGGDSAMEEAIYLTRFASKVTVVHRRDSLRASKIMQDKAFANPKIEFVWDSEIADISDVLKGEVTAIVIRNLKTGQLRTLPPRRSLHRHRAHSEHIAFPGPAPARCQRLHHYPRWHAHQRARCVCRRRRAGSHLPSGCNRRRFGLHGRHRRRALSRRRSTASQRSAASHGVAWTRRSRSFLRSSMPPTIASPGTARTFAVRFAA